MVFLQDPEDVSPIMAVRVFPQALPGLQGPWESGKGAWSLIHALWKTDIKDLGNVFRLTDWKPVPVNV